MTEQNNKQVQLTPEQAYLQSILNKFNADPSDPTLSAAERILLQKVMVVEKEVNDLAQKFVELSNEVKQKQEEMNGLNQEIILKRGKSQGLVDSLLALRMEEEQQPV